MVTKQHIRNQVFQARKELSNDILHKKSLTIFDKIISSTTYLDADSIFIYVDFNNEVGTKNIISYSLLCGKKVAVPRICNDSMEFFYITSLEDLAFGYFGILEPITTGLAIPGTNSYMIMPGVGFDFKRHRIGYGKGYYDRYLAKYPDIKTTALAFDFQVFESLPFEETDKMPENIITETITID